MTARDTIAEALARRMRQPFNSSPSIDTQLADAVLADIRSVLVEDLPDVDIKRLRDTTPESHRSLAAWHLAVARALEAER
jgi:hypothetical protein